MGLAVLTCTCKNLMMYFFNNTTEFRINQSTTIFLCKKLFQKLLQINYSVLAKMSPLKFWFKSRLKSTGKLLFLQLISVCLSITSYLSSLSTAYQSFFVPFSVGTLIYLSSITIFLVSFVHRLKLPLPNGFNVEKVFGKYQIPPSNAGTGAFPQDESACRCHYFKNHTEKGKLSESRLCSVPPSHNLGLTTIGHRGAGKDAPENSLAAIRKCASNGCSMVELDVTLTKDYVPVLFHDDNLQRIMGVDRMMSEVNWEDLKEMTISEQYPAERVPKLEEAMELCLSLGLRFIIDIKEEHKKVNYWCIHFFGSVNSIGLFFQCS